MFSLDSLLQDAFPHRNTPAWQRSLLRTLLFEKEFKQFAADYPHLKGLDLVEQVVDYFNLSCELVDGDLENIPSQGPVVLVANHPIGSLDGLVLLRAVAAVRPDVKVVASQLLTYIEPLRNLFVPVDNVAYKTSRKQIEGMQRQLDNQGALILFPAGEVSRMSPKGIRDGHWHTGFLRLAAKARAPIVPIHISARNSNLFYFTSLVYRPLSTLLLVREMFQQRGGRYRYSLEEIFRPFEVTAGYVRADYASFFAFYGREAASDGTVEPLQSHELDRSAQGYQAFLAALN
ncbi:TPA: 1-acyl-sn-glycerol-3-phosphate acyltransferase [Serratia marcescens]